MSHCTDLTCGDIENCPLCKMAALSTQHRGVIEKQLRRRPRPSPREVCPHLGKKTGYKTLCKTCKGGREEDVYECSIFSLAVIASIIPADKNVKACQWCSENPKRKKRA